MFILQPFGHLLYALYFPKSCLSRRQSEIEFTRYFFHFLSFRYIHKREAPKAVSRKEPMIVIADRVLNRTLLKIRMYVKGATFPPNQVQRNGVAFAVPVRMYRWHYDFGTD